MVSWPSYRSSLERENLKIAREESDYYIARHHRYSKRGWDELNNMNLRRQRRGLEPLKSGAKQLKPVARRRRIPWTDDRPYRPYRYSRVHYQNSDNQPAADQHAMSSPPPPSQEEDEINIPASEEESEQ